MIIKSLNIRNFRSYYASNQFEFSKGLTLIVGDNGDGKTTFFEALQWLFDTTPKGNASIDHVSEMCKSKLEIGETNTVSVVMTFDHDGEKQLEKSFVVERRGDAEFRVSGFKFIRFQSNGTERVQVPGNTLVFRCFDAFIRNYSMFKGESTLNVFNRPTALKELVEKFSDVKKFEELVSITSVFKEKAEKAFLAECRKDKKISSDTQIIENKLTRVSSDIHHVKADIRSKRDSAETYRSQLDQLEGCQEVADRFHEIQERQKNLQEKANRLMGSITSVNLNLSLLDRLWILCAFPSILQEFKRKTSALSREKRKLDKEYIAERSKEIGKQEALNEMLGALENGAPKLPWYMPTPETMEEMLSDHICKVCGREAPEGSEAYLFMKHKLEEYKRHLEEKEKLDEAKNQLKEEHLFSSSYIEEIHNLSIQLSGEVEAGVVAKKTEIKDRLSVLAKLRLDYEGVKSKIQDLEDDKARLVIQADISENLLEKKFNDIKNIFDLQKREELRLQELEIELDRLQRQESDLKKELDELTPQSSQVKTYRDVHRTFEKIAEAFSSAKNENLRRFLSDLEVCANEYVERLSANDFHGEINLHHNYMDGTTEIKLKSSNGAVIKNPSGSQETVMYMSVLFAISDFTRQKRDEDYPLIFDAATSSFGDSKEEHFYNVIDELHKQCIIVTKDYITKGEIRMADVDKLTCGVYRIRKAPNFDNRNMATIRTIVEKIK